MKIIFWYYLNEHVLCELILNKLYENLQVKFDLLKIIFKTCISAFSGQVVIIYLLIIVLNIGCLYCSWLELLRF